MSPKENLTPKKKICWKIILPKKNVAKKNFAKKGFAKKKFEIFFLPPPKFFSKKNFAKKNPVKIPANIIKNN